MKTIVICNLKGGVAKTTTVINMAAILAKDYEKSVLVIDADSQCNTSEFFGADMEQPTLADMLRDPEQSAVVQPSNFPGVSILPGSDSLMDLDLTKVELGSVQTSVLRDLVDNQAVQRDYDYCIVDCPPAFNAASAAALLAADEVIIPIKLDAFSLRGMSNMACQIANMRQINPDLKLVGLLPTMWYRDERIEASEQTLREKGYRLFYHIRDARKVNTMTYAQEPLVAFSPRSAAGVDYRRFVQEYLGGDLNG